MAGILNDAEGGMSDLPPDQSSGYYVVLPASGQAEIYLKGVLVGHMSREEFEAGRLSRPMYSPAPQHNTSVDHTTEVLYSRNMTSTEFKRWLQKEGCSFESGKGGHLHVLLGDKRSVLPMHGKNKEIGKGLELRIKKDLGLK